MTTIRRNGLTRKSNYFASAKDSDCTKPETMELLPPTFNKIKTGTTPDDFRRPAFKGLECSNKWKDADISSKRSGLGNNLLLRPSFSAPSIAPNAVVDYLLQAKIEAQQQGMKVTLGDSTLTKLFEITTGDPQDVGWIAEYKRRKALGETDEFLRINPPFGRPQRIMKKMVNFAEASNLATESSLGVTELLKTIQASLVASASDTEVKDAIAKILGVLRNTEDLGEENSRLITRILNTTPAIPSTSAGWVPGRRFYSNDQVLADRELLLAYLLKSPVAPMDISSITGKVINFLVYGRSGKAMPFEKSGDQARQNLRDLAYIYDENGTRIGLGAKFYLDITTKRIVNRSFVVDAVNKGADGGKINGESPPTDSLGNKRWLTPKEEEDALKALGMKSENPIPYSDADFVLESNTYKTD